MAAIHCYLAIGRRGGGRRGANTWGAESRRACETRHLLATRAWRVTACHLWDQRETFMSQGMLAGEPFAEERIGHASQSLRLRPKYSRRDGTARHCPARIAHWPARMGVMRAEEGPEMPFHRN